MSPRPRKERRCSCPFRPEGGIVYKPTGVPMSQVEKEAIPMDEFEAIRLCDVEGMTQEEAGQEMGVSRGTVQRLVQKGRKRLIQAMIDQKAILLGRDE